MISTVFVRCVKHEKMPLPKIDKKVQNNKWICIQRAVYKWLSFYPPHRRWFNLFFNSKHTLLMKTNSDQKKSDCYNVHFKNWLDPIWCHRKNHRDFSLGPHFFLYYCPTMLFSYCAPLPCAVTVPSPTLRCYCAALPCDVTAPRSPVPLLCHAPLRCVTVLRSPVMSSGRAPLCRYCAAPRCDISVPDFAVPCLHLCVLSIEAP